MAKRNLRNISVKQSVALAVLLRARQDRSALVFQDHSLTLSDVAARLCMNPLGAVISARDHACG